MNNLLIKIGLKRKLAHVCYFDSANWYYRVKPSNVTAIACSCGAILSRDPHTQVWEVI